MTFGNGFFANGGYFADWYDWIERDFQAVIWFITERFDLLMNPEQEYSNGFTQNRSAFKLAVAVMHPNPVAAMRPNAVAVMRPKPPKLTKIKKGGKIKFINIIVINLFRYKEKNYESTRQTSPKLNFLMWILK